MKRQKDILERYLTQAEERQLFATVKARAGLLARRDYYWMRLLRLTGIRVGTLAGLTVMDAQLTLKNHRLPVRAENAKGGKGGSVYATKHACEAVRKLLQIRKLQGHALDSAAPLIMSRQQGQGLSVRSFQDRLVYWRNESSLAVHASPHWFRHTLGQRIMQHSTAQDPRGVVKEVLLHSSIESTAIYTRPTRAAVETALEEVC